MKKKKNWSKPKLKVLVRGNLVENVLSGCGLKTVRGEQICVPQSQSNC